MAKLKSFVRTELHGTVQGVKLIDLPNGDMSIIEFSIPYNENYKDKVTGEWKSTPTEWYNMQVWGGKSNGWFQSAIRTIVDGAYVVVTDCMRKTSSYEDKKTGEVKYTSKYKVNQFRVIGTEVDSEPTSGGKASRGDGDMPF